jgi:hypothetical protein
MHTMWCTVNVAIFRRYKKAVDARSCGRCCPGTNGAARAPPRELACTVFGSALALAASAAGCHGCSAVT